MRLFKSLDTDLNCIKIKATSSKNNDEFLEYCFFKTYTVSMKNGDFKSTKS